MLEEIDAAVIHYLDKWSSLVAKRRDAAFFESLKPVAAGWKVADRSEYDRLYAELHDGCDKIIETWMNGRWIAKLHLKDGTLSGGIEILKLMQRRPGSEDSRGLDHLDFYSRDAARAEEVLRQEPDLKWSAEANDAFADYQWVSVWFAGTEAKIKADTVLDIVTDDLQALNRRIIDKKP